MLNALIQFHAVQVLNFTCGKGIFVLLEDVFVDMLVNFCIITS